jgi:hypothetical protein
MSCCPLVLVSAGSRFRGSRGWGFESEADVNDLLSMSVCAMLWGMGETSLSNSLELGTITQFITLDEYLARPQSTIHSLWTDRPRS